MVKKKVSFWKDCYNFEYCRMYISMIMPLAENICIKMTIRNSLDMFVKIWCVPIWKSNFHAELNISFFWIQNRCEIKNDRETGNRRATTKKKLRRRTLGWRLSFSILLTFHSNEMLVVWNTLIRSYPFRIFSKCFYFWYTTEI